MHTVRVLAPAKVNLALRVGAPRADGFHPLDTVFEALDLFDDITVTESARPGIGLTFEGMGAETLPTDSTNLVIKAAQTFAERAELEATGLRIHVVKRIPIAGGMAGGSADAAGTLVALNEFWGVGATAQELLEVGAGLGSDVPFCLMGGLARGRGRGEALEPLIPGAMHSWVFLTNPTGLSTPSVFREFDRLNSAPGQDPAPTDELCRALAESTIDSVAALMINDLEAPAYSLRPELKRAAEQLEGLGVVLLSGSGPTLAVLADDATTADAVAGRVKTMFPQGRVLRADGPAAGAHVVEAA